MSIKVIVNGAQGRMGRVTEEAISQHEDFTLVAALNKKDDLAAQIAKHDADVVVDFTVPQAVFANAQTIIAAGARPVIGTTGLTDQQIETLANECQRKKLGAVIAPNFSLGAVLMMRYAQDAAKYLDDVEIIEMHHPLKLDAPSGTAIKTAHMMAKVRDQQKNQNDSARGANYYNIPIHSVRLPGLFAHQMVIFGGYGETLTIKHDSTDRRAMMPGVCLACRKVMNLDSLIYGLENLLS